MSFTVLLKFCNNPVTNTSETFLWLNKSLKYKSEFSDAGIVDAQQIVDINGNFKSYDEIATEYDLIPINCSFIEYIKIISAVTHYWQLNSVGYLITKEMSSLKMFYRICKLVANQLNVFMIIFFQE